MMRTDSLLIGLMLLTPVGCASLPTGLDEISSRTNLLSDRIDIVATAHPPGGAATQYHFVIEKDGKSLGTLFHGERSFDEGRTLSLELPMGVHAESLAMLDETRFFRMTTIEPGWSADTKVQSSIEIHYRGRRHVVKEIGKEGTEDGYNKLWLFLGEVQQRSTVLNTKIIPRPPYGKRTADKLGGVITGLTDAGTSTSERNPPNRNK